MGFEYFVFCKNLVFCALMRAIYVLHGFCMLCIWLVYYVSVVPVLCLSCACSLYVMTLVKHDHRMLLKTIYNLITLLTWDCLANLCLDLVLVHCLYGNMTLLK